MDNASIHINTGHCEGGGEREREGVKDKTIIIIIMIKSQPFCHDLGASTLIINFDENPTEPIPFLVLAKSIPDSRKINTDE